MDKKILQKETPDVRFQMLTDNATRSELFNYAQTLTPEEIAQLKDKFTQKSIEVAKLRLELADIKADYKSRMKPIEDENATILGELELGVRSVAEDVYLLPDQNEGLMGYYNKDGELVYDRPLSAGERQLRIDHKATGTDDK